jgi:hypothetical protein
MLSCNKTRRHFTEAAREAAALARQRKRDHRSRFPDDHKLVMVVVRAAGPAMGFHWQIRRFGQMSPVVESRDRFVCPVEAGRWGQAALTDMKIETTAN